MRKNIYCSNVDNSQRIIIATIRVKNYELLLMIQVTFLGSATQLL